VVSILRQLHSVGEIDYEVGRRSLKRARDESMDIDTSYGKLIKQMTIMVDYKEQDIHYVHPAAMLAHAANQVDGFGRFLFDKLTAVPCTPSSPWRLVFYCDEITMGNPLKHHNKRKLWAVYWSFMEFGPELLSCEQSWFTLTTLRSTTVSALEGGVSEFMKLMMLTFYQAGSNLFTEGLLLNTPLGPAVLFASLRVFVADAEAIKHTWDVKGHTGTLCCCKCRNVVVHTSQALEHDHSGKFLPSTEIDVRRFVPQTDRSLREAIEFLGSQKLVLGKGAFKNLQQTLGLNHNPPGVLMCVMLMSIIKPMEMTMYDWMHVFLVSGIFQIEVGLLLQCLSRELRISCKELHDFTILFRWPVRLESRTASAKNAFEKKPQKGEFKCSASDALSIYPVLRLFLMRIALPKAVGNDKANAAFRSYFSLCEVLDLLRSVQKGNVHPDELLAAIQAHLRQFQTAYDVEHWAPKFHYALHLPAMLREHGHLLSCFVHERKHKEIKRYGQEVDNTHQGFERGILEAVLYVHLACLGESGFFAGATPHLVGQKPASSELAACILQELGITDDVEVLCSKQACVSPGQFCSRNDVIVVRGAGRPTVGQVWFHFQIEGECLTCFAPWPSLGNNTFQVRAEPDFVFTADVMDTATYTLRGDQALLAPMKL